MTVIEMYVHMDCAGCESKVRKYLLRLKGVDEVDIDMAAQKVTVTGWADQKKVLKRVRKTGKRAELWQLPHDPLYMNLNNLQCYQQHQYNGSVANRAAPQPSSSYNYQKHGYDYGDIRGNHQAPPGQQMGAAFSDENPHGCSVM